ncbi:hypothetical protein [Pseudoclavibacter sp. RFBA6]|uniref:hypothetical protein n=1 Tax=Pseudoclavibacter sp. RFBA6 TaxID=2080573 RepID=UPI000CE834F1|nr:hypothetical protein [Pseudoclavibacter sp. RFBA6]PPG40473.1 hypothetical protein C5C17_06580 [Pseudoclavibacter sp. RFBA6]
MNTRTECRWILAGLVLLSILVVAASFQTGDLFLRILLILPTTLLWVVYREAARRRRAAQVSSVESGNPDIGRS